MQDSDVRESVCKAATLTPLADFTDGLSAEEHVSVSFLKAELQLFNEEVLKAEAEDSELSESITAPVISSLREKYDHAAADDLLNTQQHPLLTLVSRHAPSHMTRCVSV